MQRIKKAISLAIGLALCWAAGAQQNANIQLLANANDFPQSGYSDIWGYVDKAGREYAILGVRSGTAVYLLEDPRKPRRVAFIPGAQSIWRDMKSFGDYVYVVADQGADGILALDMSKAPDTITHTFHKPVIGVNTLNRCHNLHIDKKGAMFLSGCNINNGSVLMFDVASVPGTPKFIGGTNSRYSHDNFSRGDTLWSADVYLGEFSVLDVSNKQAPRLLATQPTSSRFTHNCWLSDDGKYLFTTDEKNFGTVDAYDVSNLNDIRFLDKFLPKNATANRAIPHNTHYYKGFLVTSWYTEGVIITDAHRPQNLVETGNYDTYLQSRQGFEGCWGAYPYLPSGILLASDISTGLYVLLADYKRACYLEGKVVDAQTGQPISGAQIKARDIELNSDALGFFKGGSPDSGAVAVTISADGYATIMIEGVFHPSQVTEIEARLEKTGVVSSIRDINRYEGVRLQVLPNPCSGDCQAVVELPETWRSGQLEIWNALGQKITTFQVAPGTSSLPIPAAEMPSGIYFLRLAAHGKVLAGMSFLARQD